MHYWLFYFVYVNQNFLYSLLADLPETEAECLEVVGQLLLQVLVVSFRIGVFLLLVLGLFW